MATKENLQAAFAGESQANRKYLAFAKKAETDGYPAVAKLFRGVAAAETVHAHAHFRVLDGVKSTVENVKAAIAGEGYEVKDMYPAFVAQAEKDGDAAALRSFTFALEVEKVHYAMYQKALQALQGGKDLAGTRFFVCEVCGNTVEGQAPDKCTVCGAGKAKFTEVQ